MKIFKYLGVISAALITLLSCSDDDTTTMNDEDPNAIELIATDVNTTINENPEEGLVLGRIEVNESDGTIYVVTDSDPQGAFFVNDLGQVLVSDPAAFDYESRTSITGIVTITNGEAQTTSEVTVNLNDADDLFTLLTTSRNDYENANGSWIEVTKAEYDLLAERIKGTERIGVPENVFTSNAEVLQTAGGITVANNIDIPMPSGSYLYAFKYYSTSGTQGNNDGQVRPKVSEQSQTSGYSGRGPLPAHEDGYRYFVEAVSFATQASNSYLAVYSPYSMGWVENNQSEMYFRFGNGSQLTNGVNNVQVLIQGLVTDQKQWD